MLSRNAANRKHICISSKNKTNVHNIFIKHISTAFLLCFSIIFCIIKFQMILFLLYPFIFKFPNICSLSKHEIKFEYLRNIPQIHTSLVKILTTQVLKSTKTTCKQKKNTGTYVRLYIVCDKYMNKKHTTISLTQFYIGK